MNKILKKISAVVQMVLLAPVKLPGKALNIIRYVALGLGVLEAVTGEGSDKEPVPNSLRGEGSDEEGYEGSVSNSLRDDGGDGAP